MLLKRQDMAYLGLLLALNQIFIILSSIIETNTMILFAGAALTVGVAIAEFGVKSGIVFYAASVILGFVVSFNKVEMVTYAIFFGIYSIIKYYVEKRGMRPVFEIAIKFVFYNMLLTILYVIMKGFIALHLYWWMVAIAQVMFLIYDFAFTVFINYYMTSIGPKLRKR